MTSPESCANITEFLKTYKVKVAPYKFTPKAFHASCETTIGLEFTHGKTKQEAILNLAKHLGITIKNQDPARS